MRGTSDGVTERKEQDMAKDQDKKGIPKVQIDMFNWGPCVVRMRINEDFQNKLLDEAKKILTEGKSDLIEDFVSKRGRNFPAFLFSNPTKLDLSSHLGHHPLMLLNSLLLKAY